jgi:hypothetical protein
MKNQYPLFCFLFYLPFFVFAQQENSFQKSNIEFAVGLNRFNTIIKQVDPTTIGIDSLLRVESVDGLGATVEIAYRHQFSNFIGLRFGALLSFKDVGNTYFFNNGHQPFTRSRGLVNSEFPLHFLFGKQTRKWAPTFLVGTRYSIETASDGRTWNLDLHPNDLLLDVGIGLRFQPKLTEFKLEFLFSRGLFNQLDSKPTYPLNNVITSLYNQTLHLRFSLAFSKLHLR